MTFKCGEPDTRFRGLVLDLAGWSVPYSTDPIPELRKQARGKSQYRSGARTAKEDLTNGIIRYAVQDSAHIYYDKLNEIAKEKYNVEIFYESVYVGHGEYVPGYQDTVLKYLEDEYSTDPIAALINYLSENTGPPNQNIDPIVTTPVD